MLKNNLKSIRKMKGLTQHKLAVILNVSDKTICHWESGYSEPSLILLAKLREVLNASYEELLD